MLSSSFAVLSTHAIIVSLLILSSLQEYPDPERIDKENPEWTANTFKRARPAREVLPEVVPPKLAAEMLKPKRGRPAGSTKTDAKQAVNLRLDPDVLAVLRATGPGWQTRVNTMLRERFAL